MSYILEALKKAQAERQLGSAPTLHAVPVGAAPRAASGARRPPIWLALVAIVLAVALALLVWRVQAPDAVRAAPTAAITAPAFSQPAAPSVTPVPVPSPTLALVPPPLPAPVSAAPSKPVAARVMPAAPIAPAPPVATPSVTASAEEKLPSLRELPEAIQRAVPALTFGGYMYSKDPADRLLLIDKSLRHEGEEVAPGLVLEKLLPKAALMNYKGYRYRVPY